MRKHYIIDGYNVIHASPELRRISEAFGVDRVRTELLNGVREFAERRGCDCTIVFDGAANENDSRGRVRVISTRTRSADEVIRREARARGKDLVVVTSDLEIVSVARTNMAVVIPSAEFMLEIDLIPSNTDKPFDRRSISPRHIEEIREETEKPRDMSDDEMDEWKKLFGA